MAESRVMLFAGTAEGRCLYRYLAKKGIPADVYTATEYGKVLLETQEGQGEPPERTQEGRRLPVLHAGRLTEAGIAAEIERCLALLRKQGEGTLWVIDATHPYACEATANIRRACENAGTVSLQLLRLVRPSVAEELQGGTPAASDSLFPLMRPGTVRGERRPAGAGEEEPGIVWVQDAAEAAAYLDAREGHALITTGSKELAAFTAVKGFRERLYVRLLPLPELVRKATELGFAGQHLYCMQGPFSEEMNELLLRETGSRFLVTKEAGREGGFPEKLTAAGRAGAVCVVIRRPGAEKGYTRKEIERLLEERL